jgi:hypothetical protein
MIELHPVTLDSEETIYDDKETIQDPVNNQKKEIKLRPVDIPVEEPNVQEKLPISKNKPIELHPVTDLNTVTPEEDSIPELQPIRAEKDPIKRRENIDNELEKFNRQRADLIKHEPMRRNINGEIIMGPGEEKRQSDLAEVEKKITGLRTERIQITHNEIDPVDSTTKKDIGDATLFDGTINSVKKFSNAVFKYGEKKIDRVESDELDKAYSDYEQNQFKTALAEKNPDKLWNWNTIKYADRPKLDPRASGDIQKIFTTAEADPMFYGHGKSGTFDFNTKAKVIQKNLNEYIDKHYPDITPEAKEKKILDYTQWLVPSLAFGNKGEGSPAGLKMNAANELVKLQDRHDELTQIKEKLDKMEFNRPDGSVGPWDEATPELTKQSYESFQAYKERIKKKYDLVTRAMDFNLSILKTPEQRRGIRDFATKGGLGYPNAKDLISMNISEMQRTLNVAEISKKVENHEDLSWEEKQIMDQYATLQSLQSLGTVGTFAQVGAGITAMAPYMASFAFSGGAFTAGEKLAQRGIETGAEKLISAGARKSLTSALTYHLPNFSKAARVLGQAKFSIPEMATKAAGFTAGSIAQTLVLPQYYVKNIAERTIPNMQHILTPDMKDLVTQIDANTGEKLGSAIWKGGTDAFWEISTERLGRDLLKLSKIPGRAINSALGRDVPKQIIAEEFMKLKGFKSVPELVRHVQENVLGWHGIKEEYFEELVNQLGSMATSGDRTTLPDFLNNQITTFLTVGIFGGGMSVGEYGMKHIRYGSIGDNTVYVSQSQKQGKEEIARIQGLLDKNPGSEELKRQLASAKGKKEKIYIPNVIHDKLLKIFNDYDNIDESGLANLITQVQSDKDPEKRLSDRQVKFILDLAIQEGARKNERNAVINSIKKSGIMTTDLFVTPEYDSTKDYDQLLTEEDMNNIQKKNELIKKRYQGLDEMDLLERDNTGQLVEPDIDYLTELKSQLEEENKQASKQKADGTYELHDQSAIKEIDKEITQLQEAQKKGPLQSITDRIDKLTREKAHISTTLPYEAVVLNRKIQEVDSELNKLADQEDVGFAFMKPSEKQKILQDELRMKNPLEGHIDPISNKQLLVTLDDGRQVVAFMGPHEGKGETPADYKNRGVLMMDTWQNKKKVTLKLVPKADWNADDEAHEIYKDSRGVSYKIPYGDKIDVQVDGKTIASVQVHDYNEKQILEAKFNKAKELFKARMGELTMRLVNKTGGVATIMSLNDGEKVNFLKDIVNSIVEMTKVKASQAMAWVKQLIAESDLLQKDKDDLTSLAELNEGNIMRHVMSAKLAAQGKAKKVVPLDLQSMVFENSESVALSSGDKINSQLKTFAPLWVSIAEEHELSKEEVELAFLGISKLNMDAVRNDDTFHAWLMSQRTGDKATDAILSRFLSISWSQALSFFDFYSNVVLAKQYGMYYTKKKGMEFKLLNPSEQYGEMTSIFNKNLRTFTAKELRTKVKAYADQVNKDFQMYRTLDAKGKYDLKKAQFYKDLQFLYEVTGIPAEVWSNYFSEQTKETYQYTKKGDPRATNFKTMENLFKEEPLRLNGDPWRQSNLMMNLLFGSMQSKYKKDVEAGVLQDVAFMKHFKNYFLKGEGKSLSNLFKLSTSIKGSNEVGLSGQDIKSDQFSSFIQYSDITNTAENILTSTLNNPLVAYYKAQGKAIDLVLLNGIHNLSKNRAKKGTSSINMSMEDLWVSLISLYQQGTGSYMHSLGQFKDKPTIYLMEAPKVDKPTAEQIKHLDKIFGLDNFNNTVNYLLDNIVEFNQDIFAKGEATNEMIRGFVYNYAVNTLNSNQIFFGEQTKESYPKGILSLVKRAGSSNSPGYRLNRFTEGGIGKSFRFAIANDKAFIDHLGNKLTAEAFDGMIFMSGDTARKMQVSMGSIYSKQNEYPILDSVKAVISYKDPGTNTRGLTKPNIINIDIASETGSPTYKAIQDYMKKNKIDVLSFTSSSKIIAKEKVINLFNEDGSFNAGAEAIHGTHVTDMNTNNLYIQQDLRHAITPKSTKMPAPFLANMMSLPNGKSIAGMISEMQRLGIENLERDLSKTEIDVAKKAWLEENVNKFSQPDLKRLLKAGLTIDDPTYRKMMQTILTAAISRRALEIPINRVTTQEIPDVDGILMPYTPAKDGKHTLLAEVITGVEGGREHNYKYEGKVKEAIQYVKDNPEEFADLFDLAGNLMEWEITDRNGVIPGEVIILNRVPAHALVSHHVARLKKNLLVNFTMINKKSQLASGSDSDGDQRYNQVFYRNGEGKILLGEPESAILGYTEEEIANRIMMLVAEDYTDIVNFDAIDRPIDKGAYDATVNRIREADKRTFKSIDPRAFEEARLNNIVGVLMKGILTDHNTIFSIISRYNMFFKVKKNLVFETDETEVEGSVIIKNIRLDQIAKDAYGAIKAHIGNFQNLAFDNADDPKIETLGYNEVTANMFTLALIGDNRNSSSNFRSFEEHYEYIKSAIDRQADYFTSPLVRQFTSMVRRNNGGMRNEDIKVVFTKLTSGAKSGKWTEQDVKNLKALYYAGNEILDFGKLYSLTQEAPKTFADFLMARDLVERVKNNKMSILDTRSLFVIENGNAEWVRELRIIDKVMEIAEDYIFEDSVEQTPVGMRIRDYVLAQMQKNDPKKKKLSKPELESISSAINAVFNIRMIHESRSFDQLNKEILSRFPALKEEFKDNPFFKYLDIIENDDAQNEKFRSEVRVIPEYAQAGFRENVLSTIREGFSKLPSDVKGLFAAYTLSRFGASTLVRNGGFYSFLDDKSRVKMSKMASDEMEQWYFDELSPMEQLNIANWVLKISKNEAIKKLAAIPSEDRIIDINRDATTQSSLHRDAIEGLYDINDIDQFLSWENQYDPTKVLRTVVETKHKVSIESRLQETIQPYRNFRDNLLAIANKHFPQNQNEPEIKDYHDSPAGHAMLSQDPNLVPFIYNHLQKQYPGIRIFVNREAFYDFVRKNTNRMLNVDPTRIGHAFKNAIFIDPTKSIQDVLFHEHAHIYWDALPVNHPAKNRILSLYEGQENAEEKAIIDIGRAGTDIGNTFLNGNLYDKFLLYLKDFWRSVKSVFGIYSNTDLVNDLAWAIWTNQDSIKPASAQGEAEIKNFEQYDYTDKQIDRDKTKHTVTIGGKQIYGVNTMIKRKENSKFDPDERLDERLKKFQAAYKEITGKNPTPETLFEEMQAIELEWNDKTIAGSAIHSIAEEVFSGKTIAPEHLARFAPTVADQLRKSMVRLKNEILAKYPDATFLTEQDLISTKYMIFGVADLLVDIGNNKILVFDFKTTSSHYKTPEGKLTPQYRMSYGLMKSPLQNIHQSKQTSHTLQLRTYAQIIEEQKNKNNPTAKNEVVGLYVVPILRQLDGNGKIILAEISQVVVPAETFENQSPVANIWDNLIDVPYERGFVDGLLKDNLGFTQGFTDKYVSFKNHLDKTQFPEALKDELLSAYSYISNIAGDDLARMSYIALEDMRGDSLNGIVSQLIALDFTRDDMSTLPFEAMLNIAKNNISKEKWESEKETLFSLQKVGSNKVKKINPKRIANTWYHKTFAFEDNKVDHYFHEAGTKTLNVNDLVIQIYSVKGSSGKVYDDYSYARVTKINKKAGIVHLKDEESGQTFQIGNVEDSEGILKVLVNADGEEFNNDGSQVTPIPEREVTPNNYVPRFIDIDEDVLERHWNFPFVRKQAESTAEGKAEERSHLHSQRLLWKWFNEFQRIKDIRGFIDNQDATAELYHNIASFESDVSFTLTHFLQETLLNHYQATQIRIEHAQGPSINMPMTLNTFYMLTRPEKAFIDFRGIWRSAYYLMPARLLEAKSTGANFILMGMENALRKIGEDQFELNQKMEKYFNHVNLDDITRTIRGRKFYRTPDMQEFKESEISKIKNEIKRERKRMARLALETIYEHYYKYDYKYIAAKQRAEKQGIIGYPLQIPVSKFFSTQRELANIENSKGDKPIGRKWAAILHYLMKPGLYDDIKLLTDQLDSKGKPKIMTFADIKDSFALENATDAEIQEWMGTRKKILGMYFSRHSFIKMPVVRKYISAGKLYNYYKKAADIYIHGDENNVKSVRKGNRITTLGNRRVRYNTGHLLEAETKVMESNIAAMYLKRLAAPLDYIKAHYDKDTEAFKYIKDLTDFLVYKKSPALGTEWSAMVDYLARATSLSRIAWSPKTNIMNFVIGQGMDTIREPEAYLKGIKRFITNPKKAISILKRYQLANITDEARFDELAKAIGTKVTINGQEHLLSWDAFMDMGYLPMEWAEKANQLPIFIGLMTDEEFNSYDDTGKIIDKDRALSMNRKILLSDMVRDIHGDYGPQNAAPFWNTNWGKALLQFKKYYPATLFAEFSPYHLDRQYIVRSGIMPTMSFLFRMAKYNMSSSSTQYKRIKESEKIIQQKIKEGNLDHVFFKNTKEYFQQFLASREEGNIQWKELSDNDKKNAVSFVLQMTILSSLILAKLAIAGGSGKDKKQLPANLQWWWQTLNRVQTDIFFYTNSQNASNLIKTPTAMLNTAIAMGQTITQVGEWIFYSAKRGELYPNEVQQKKDTPYLLEGEPKIIKSMIGWVPLGGLLSSALTWRMALYNNQDFVRWMEKQNVDPNIVESVKQMFTVEKGKQKVSDEANQYDAIMKEYILYQMGESMSGEELSAYGAMMNYYKEMMQNVDDAQKSIMLEQLKDVVMQGDPKFLDKMHEKAVDVTNTLDKNKYRSLKKKKSYYDETQLELNKK